MKALKSIRVQLLTIMLLCYLVPTLILGEYMGNVFFADLRAKTETALSSSVEHACTLSLQSVERAVGLAREATYDGELSDIYSGYESGALSSAEFLRQSRSYIERKYSRENLFTFALYYPVSDPTMLVYNRSGYEETVRCLREAGDAVRAACGELDTRCRFMEEQGRVYLVRNLMNLRMERFGILVLGVNTGRLLADVQALAGTWDGEVQVMLGQSGAGDVDWDAQTEGLCERPEEDKLVYTRRERNSDYDFAMRLSVSRDRIYGEIRAFRRLMTGLFVLLIPILALMLLYLHKRIVRPISLLSQASGRIEAGELGVTVPMHGDDELGQLGRAFSQMSLRIEELIDKTYKEEIALRDAKIQSMQSRINPHFLNNALENLNWEARLEGSQTMSGMVEALSILLNASMGRANRRMVPLCEELEVARAYCYFVRLRYGDRLQVHDDFDEGAMNAVVPLLTLQPLLENAVQHGIEPAGGGEIHLSGMRAGDLLRLTVVNSGKPLDEEDWGRIRLAMAGDNQEGHHLGLANICTRLRLIYGGRARLFVSQDGQGRTVVRLEIPLKEEET